MLTDVVAVRIKPNIKEMKSCKVLTSQFDFVTLPFFFSLTEEKGDYIHQKFTEWKTESQLETPSDWMLFIQGTFLMVLNRRLVYTIAVNKIYARPPRDTLFFAHLETHSFFHHAISFHMFTHVHTYIITYTLFFSINAQQII